MIRFGALVAAVLTAGAACSASGPALPKASAFHPGLCQQAAPALLATARRAAKGGKPTALAADLQTQQSQLRRFIADQHIQDLVTAIGLVRFQVDSHSYTDQLRKNVETAAQRSITVCTGN